MSHTIMYQRAAIKVNEEEFILLMQVGANNCTMINENGNEVRERHWLTYYTESQDLKKPSIKYSELNVLEEELQGFRDGDTDFSTIWKSGRTRFPANQFTRHVLNAVRHAHTVEEYFNAGNTISIYGYRKPKKENGSFDVSSNDYDVFSHTKWKHVSTTEELLEEINELSADETVGKISVVFFTDKRLYPVKRS